MKFDCESRIKSLVKLISLIAISFFLVSCETIGYYTQAVRGHLGIMLGREDIQRLINDPSLSPGLKMQFNEVMRIREFAANELSLPLAGNYSAYVHVERDHLVWNVFAAPEFSTKPLNWCYPIAGCVAYRGYFTEAGALNYANQLAEEGFDVYTGGVDAYSTLGWFDDPLFSTVMTRKNYQLAGLIFHELAHQIAYLPGDTTFNESFATTVEREGLRRWLERMEQEETIRVAEIERNRQQQFIDLVVNFRDQFDELYAEELNENKKRKRKRALQAKLLSEYESLKLSWGGYAGYDNWFSRSLNNAQLSTVSSYNDLVAFFNTLLGQSNGSMPEFYAEVRRIIALPDNKRRELLGRF
ncbi:MAG: aminopeptidase [Gammaproteobacteria bacterium]|nr:aminopeptidase [Gammaproteobacteria bacterium]